MVFFCGKAYATGIMRRFASKILWVILTSWILGLFITGIGAYMVKSVNIGDGIVHDGLGRELRPAPFFLKFFFGAEPMYAGPVWFVVDFITFWGSIAVLFMLGKLAARLGETTATDEPGRRTSRDGR